MSMPNAADQFEDADVQAITVSRMAALIIWVLGAVFVLLMEFAPTVWENSRLPLMIVLVAALGVFVWSQLFMHSRYLEAVDDALRQIDVLLAFVGRRAPNNPTERGPHSPPPSALS